MRLLVPVNLAMTQAQCRRNAVEVLGIETHALAAITEIAMHARMIQSAATVPMAADGVLVVTIKDHLDPLAQRTGQLCPQVALAALCQHAVTA